jgi:hypothetical protein
MRKMTQTWYNKKFLMSWYKEKRKSKRQGEGALLRWCEEEELLDPD